VLAHDITAVNHFDFVVARAVAPLVDLIRWSSPLLNHSVHSSDPTLSSKRPMLRSGSLVALKGGDLNSEIEDARRSFPGTAITVINMTFDGSLEIGLEDKKVVTVELRQ